MKNQSVHVDIYEGSQDYLFISYSHADSEKVLPIVKRLSDDGVRIWYDDGIEIGSSWDDNIAHHIRNSKGVVLFFSNNYFNSDNCKDEANYARDLGKDQIIIQLEDTTIPPGMEMRFNRIQSVSAADDPELMYKKIYASSVLKNCRRIGEEVAETENVPAAPAEKKKTNKILIAAAAIAVVAAAVLIIVFATRKPEDPNAVSEQPVAIETTPEESQEPDTTAREDLTEKSGESAETKAETEPETETEAITEAKTEPETETEAITEAKTEPEPETTTEAAAKGPETITYNLGDLVESYRPGTDDVEYTIKIDSIHLMPEDFESNTWEKYDKEAFDLLSVRCGIENFGNIEKETGFLSIPAVLNDLTVLPKDPDDYLLGAVPVMYHGVDGVYDVTSDAKIPAGSKGRFALLYYVEEGTPYVTISLDNHHGVIAKTEPIYLEWEEPVTEGE